MKLALVLLLVVKTWAIALPPAQIEHAYSESITSQILRGCAIDDAARTSPAMIHGLPAGLSLSASGVVSGTPSGQTAMYEAVAVCTEARFVLRLRLTN